MAASFISILLLAAGPAPWQVALGHRNQGNDVVAAPPSPANSSAIVLREISSSTAASPSPSIANVNASVVLRGPGTTVVSMLERLSTTSRRATLHQPSYTMHAGYISQGDDLLVAKMTVEQAQIKCVQLDGCKGFTFQGNPSKGPVVVFFKSKWDLQGTGWVSYQVEEPLPDGWESAVDPKTQHTFYFNRAMGVRTWDRPHESQSPTEKRGDASTKVTSVAARVSGNDKVQNTIHQERLSMIRIQSIVKSTNWFRPYRQGADSEFVGSGFAVYSVENPDKSEKADTEDPLFITNAHVVRDAHTVQIQVPTIGQAAFDAYVPIIYSDFDLALVKLKEPAKFLDALKAAGRKLTILRIQDIPLEMGMQVAAYGFPLGSMSLKMSEGVIAGTETVNGARCYQSTAPISPGSSGGPLFALGPDGDDSEPRVIGVNFASASSSSAQNQNYVVPAIHIRQLLHSHRESQTASRQTKVDLLQKHSQVDKVKGAPLEVSISMEQLTHESSETALAQRLQMDHTRGDKAFSHMTDSTGRTIKVTRENLAKAMPLLKSLVADGAVKLVHNPFGQGDSVLEVHEKSVHGGEKNWAHMELKIAAVDAVGVQANNALYKSSGGCDKGLYLSKIQPDTALSLSDPPVPEQSFITAVDGIPLDSFGMGVTSGFLQDPLAFESIMGLHATIEDKVKISVCQQGKPSEHIVSMEWRKQYDKGVKTITEPFYHPEALEYEAFADFTVMELTLNHIFALLAHGPPTLGRWLMGENQINPRILVTDVRAGTYASRVLAPGMVLETVNGLNVSTLHDFREAFVPQSDAWTMVTDRGVAYTVDFIQSLKDQLSLASTRVDYQYLFTPHIEEVAESVGLLQGRGDELEREETDKHVARKDGDPRDKAVKKEHGQLPKSLEDLLSKLVGSGALTGSGSPNGGDGRVHIVVVNRGKQITDDIDSLKDEAIGNSQGAEAHKDAFAVNTLVGEPSLGEGRQNILTKQNSKAISVSTGRIEPANNL